MVSVACRAAFSVTVPRAVAPSKNVTGPVGVPEPGTTTLTVAVSTTGRPVTEGLGVTASAVALAALVDGLREHGRPRCR